MSDVEVWTAFEEIEAWQLDNDIDDGIFYDDDWLKFSSADLGESINRTGEELGIYDDSFLLIYWSGMAADESIAWECTLGCDDYVPEEVGRLFELDPDDLSGLTWHEYLLMEVPTEFNKNGWYDGDDNNVELDDRLFRLAIQVQADGATDAEFASADDANSDLFV